MKTNIQLLDCPFCGCKMSERDGYFIYGDHADDCYFTLADNQHTIDFFEKDNLIGLHNAWNKRRVKHPTVRQIRGDALEEITLAMAKTTAAHEQDKLVLLKIITSLTDKLGITEACIDEIEDHLNRGSDNDWAQDAIDRYRKSMEELDGNK